MIAIVTQTRPLHRIAGAGLILLLLLVVGGCVRPESANITPPKTVPQTTQTPAPAQAPGGIPLAAKITAPATGTYLGIFRPPAPFQISAFDDYEELSPKRPAILMWYQAWHEKAAQQFDPALCVAAYQRGTVPLITWEPWNPGPDANYVEQRQNQTEYQLANIVDGSFDSYIRSWAQGVKAVGGPVMLRPMHEMNGTWYPWSGTVNGNSPELFRQAWRRVHAIFVQEGAHNATWVWTVNWVSVPDTEENNYSAYYPGDEYVDWVGVSGFNWGTSTPGQRWRMFSELYENPMAYFRTLGKPIIISEIASVSDGGDKAAWITDAYERIESDYPDVDAIVYYDAREQRPEDEQDWQIESSAASARAYSEAVESDYFRTGPAPELEEWLGKLSDEDKTYLRKLKPVY